MVPYPLLLLLLLLLMVVLLLRLLPFNGFVVRSPTNDGNTGNNWDLQGVKCSHRNGNDDFFRFNAMTDEIVSNDFTLTEFFRILKSRKSHLRKVAQVAARLPTELKDLVRVPANSNFG